MLTTFVMCEHSPKEILGNFGKPGEVLVSNTPQLVTGRDLQRAPWGWGRGAVYSAGLTDPRGVVRGFPDLTLYLNTF